MATNDPPYPVADPAVVYDLAKNKLSIQLSAIDALDSKIALGISLATTLAAITLAFLGIRAGQDENLASPWRITLMVSTAATYLAALILLTLAIRNREMDTGLGAQDGWDFVEKHQHILDEDPSEMRQVYWWATSYFINAVSTNGTHYRQKLLFGTWGYYATALQFLFGGTSILATFS